MRPVRHLDPETELVVAVLFVFVSALPLLNWAPPPTHPRTPRGHRAHTWCRATPTSHPSTPGPHLDEGHKHVGPDALLELVVLPARHESLRLEHRRLQVHVVRALQVQLQLVDIYHPKGVQE